MPKVSIITASYNYAEYIGQTIESVINQTYTDWEMIIIDDGSIDNSIDIINNYVQKDDRITLLTHPYNENCGLIETLKLGISKADSKYLVFLESDDYIREDYLEKKLSFFQKNPNVGLVYNDIQTFGAEQTVTQKRYFWLIRNYWKKHNYPHFLSDKFYIRNYIPTFSCVMLKKELLDGINWQSSHAACIDWWIWAQISGKATCYFYPDKLTFWQLHNDSYLNKAKKDENTIVFLSALYELLPNVDKFVNKIIFILKQLYMLLKYKKNTLKNLKHIIKRTR